MTSRSRSTTTSRRTSALLRRGYCSTSDLSAVRNQVYDDDEDDDDVNDEAQHIMSSHHELANDDVLNEIYWFIIDDHSISSTNSPPDNCLTIHHVVDSLHAEGIWFWRDLRFRQSQDVALSMANLRRSKFSGKISPEDQETASQVVLVDVQAFQKLVCPCASLFLKAFSEKLVIPDWSTFVTDMTYHFYAAENERGGQNAQYIPILRDADPELWGLSMCSIDGQRFSVGGDSDDARTPFTLQSVSKPVTYALCLQTEGEDFVEEWVGCEPSGRPFNAQDLEPGSNRPYNASVNTGAIMCAGLFASNFPELTWIEVVEKICGTWYELAGQDMDVGFSKETFHSEKETAYNNFAIAYNLKGRRGLPRDVDLNKMLDVYLGCCSITMCVEALAVAAATLANGGVCPITGKEVFPAHVVRHVLSETVTCGMYDQAGHFAIQVGLPSKSGVSGVLMVMVPNVVGFATFSPRLNEKGNSVRGIEFCKRLIKSYRVHLFEPLQAGNTGAKVDPRSNGYKDEKTRVSRIAWALSVGDTWAVRLRDIYLFALVQAALSSREGLSDRMEALIRDDYKLVYQDPVDDKLFDEVVDAIKVSPSNLKILEDLIQNTRIPDSMRSIIMMALIEIAMIDDSVDETEKSVIIRICTLLGIDRSVALMELNRHEKHAGHRFKDVALCDADPLNRSRHGRRLSSMTSLRDQILDLSEEILEQTDQSISRKMKARQKRGVQNAATAAEARLIGRDREDQRDERIALRREVLRLKRKVDRLTMLLHDARQREARTHGLDQVPSPDETQVAAQEPKNQDDEGQKECSYPSES